MYIKIGDQFADSELNLLSELLFLLDQKIIEITNLIKSSSDPESDDLADRGEYFIGVGFSVIQQYLTDTLTFTGINKAVAFNLGPSHSENITFVSVLNSAANFWKHSPEWHSSESLRKDALHTQNIISTVTESNDYPLSNVLAKLLGSSNISLSALLPNLVIWRTALDMSRKSNA